MRDLHGVLFHLELKKEMGLLEMVRRKAQQSEPNLSVYTDYLTAGKLSIMHISQQ